MRRSFILVLLAAGLTAAAPVPKELKLDDGGRLMGEWQTERAELNGRESSSDYLIFTRDSINWKNSKDGGDIIWKLTIDPTKSPKEFEIVLNQNPNAKYLGLYKFDGDTLYLACRQNALPSGFNSENGYLHILKRVGPSK